MKKEQAWDVLMWLCAAAGSSWLLQFIEDTQQSRAFHETCELKLPNEAATIPEVLLCLSPYISPLLIRPSDFTSTAVNTLSHHKDYAVARCTHAKSTFPLSQRASQARTGGCLSP